MTRQRKSGQQINDFDLDLQLVFFLRENIFEIEGEQ